MTDPTTEPTSEPTSEPRSDASGVGGRFSLDERVCVVTGASSGLGVAIAHCLAGAGAAVVLGARRADRLEQTVESVRRLGGRAVGVVTDVRDPEQCEALVEAAVATYGHVDGLVNNAGIPSSAPATRERPDDFRAVLDVNLAGAYWMAQSFARRASPGSGIVNVSSVIALHPGVLPQAAYASSKAGLLGLTRDLAAQWTGRKGLRVNAIVPGLFPSEMSDQLDPAAEAQAVASTPAGRPGRPHEVGDACVFLLSDASSYVTGVTLAVDGGLSMH